MKFDEEQALLASAAAPTLERIRLDQEMASAQVKPLLRYLENHVFEPDLYIDRWMRACGVHDHLMPVRFHREIGLGPATYIRDCRLQTASRLLRDTSLSLSKIARIIGYSDRKPFVVAFSEWRNELPTEYRRKARARAARYGKPPEWMVSTSFLQRLEAGQITEEEADAVKERLQLLIALKSRENADEEPHEVDSDNEHERFEHWMASNLWTKIEALPFKDQKLFVANQVAYRTTALRDLLLEKSEEAEGLDREQRELLADLAEDALKRTLTRAESPKSPSKQESGCPTNDLV